MKEYKRDLPLPNIIIQGDALEVLKTFPDEFVQCVVTSPPYWGLRDYGIDGQLGLEKTPEEYIEKMVEIFREVKRVLRKDGIVWLNLGDSYAGGGRAGNNGIQKWGGIESKNQDKKYGKPIGQIKGLKSKDLVGIPWRLAFALRADGWWLRSDIIWSKPNPMPESVTDRPTKSHEYIFLLTKSAKYFYDADAVRKNYSENRPWGDVENIDDQHIYHGGLMNKRFQYNGLGRNARSVWEISTEPFPEAHFATYPTKLVAKCIKAGTSEYGACAECGSPWERVVEKELGNSIPPISILEENGNPRKGGSHYKPTLSSKTKSWQPTCECNLILPSDNYPDTTPEYLPYEIKPCIILDPFIGSGTTGLVAQRMGRKWIGIELNESYIEIAKRRLAQQELF